MVPEGLNCPNCGGAVASDRTQCEFCKTRLKTVACPSCLGLMFIGNEFCGHCGERASVVEVAAEEASGDCPRCSKKLDSLRIGPASLRECVKCGGFWMGVDTFENLCADKEQQSAVLSLISDRKSDLSIGPPVKYIPCPDCKQLMNRSNFARVSGVIIDLCKQHGVWFDANELPKIIDFIEGGGLARAREKEKIELDDERSRIRDEQLKLQMMERRSGGGNYVEDGDRSSKFGEVIAGLFGL